MADQANTTPFAPRNPSPADTEFASLMAAMDEATFARFIRRAFADLEGAA